MYYNKYSITRRELIKRFGIFAFLLNPVLRSMCLAAEAPFSKSPRFIHMFIGEAFPPETMGISSLNSLNGSAIAPLQGLGSDLILFQNMRHLSTQDSDGSEEHGPGLYSCTTGDRIRAFGGRDSYEHYTDSESIDIRIANYYSTLPDAKDLPISSLHVGGGAHSDADSVGEGQKYISSVKRQSGMTDPFANAIRPIQNVGQVYDQLMTHIMLMCNKESNQPSEEMQKLKASLMRKKSLIDTKLEAINDAKRMFGMDSEHSLKLDAMVEGWVEAEKLVDRQIAQADQGASTGRACPNITRPTGNGTNIKDCDRLSPIHDGMIAMIKLAFEWDVTRVAAFTLSGASSGHTWPSMGVNTYSHALQHNDNYNQLRTLGTYFSGKFAKMMNALKEIDDGNGQTGLNNTALMLGMGCDGTKGHRLTNIPLMVAGQAGGHWKTGQIINANNRYVNDLHLSVLNACGIQTNTFGLAGRCQGAIIQENS